MRIAGIDPGTIRTGVAILEGDGAKCALVFSKTIHAGQERPIQIRLKHIYEELAVILNEWKPEVAALESVFYQKDFKAAVKVGEARAAAMLAAGASGIRVVEYSPARVKESVCANGRATKDQVQFMIRNLLKLKEPIQADAADAAAIALCYLHSARFEELKKAALAHV